MGICIVFSFLRKSRGGDKEPVSMFPSNRTNKALYLWLTDNLVQRPFLGLHVNQRKAKLVFHDDTINSVIS